MRLIQIIAAALLLAVLVGCNKSQKEEAAPSVSNLEYRTPTQEVLSAREGLSRKSRSEAKKASPEQLELAKAVLIKESQNLGFKYHEDDKVFIFGTGNANIVSIEEAAILVAGSIISERLEFDERTLSNKVNNYFSDQISLAEARQREQEIASSTDTSGRVVEETDRKPLPKLDPADEIVGKWMSLKEIGVASGTSIAHTSSYHQYLEINSDKTLKWVYYSRNSELSNDTYKWDFNKSTGELVLRHMNGSPYQTLKVYTTQSDPGSIYIETPGLDQLKVFGPAQMQGS